MSAGEDSKGADCDRVPYRIWVAWFGAQGTRGA